MTSTTKPTPEELVWLKDSFNNADGSFCRAKHARTRFVCTLSSGHSNGYHLASYSRDDVIVRWNDRGEDVTLPVIPPQPIAKIVIEKATKR